MKKATKLFLLMMSLIAAVGFVLTGCNALPEIDKIELKDAHSQYEIGDEFKGATILIFFAEGDTTELSVSEDMVSGFSTQTAGSFEYTITYKEKQIQVPYTVSSGSIIPPIDEKEYLWNASLPSVVLPQTGDINMETIVDIISYGVVILRQNPSSTQSDSLDPKGITSLISSMYEEDIQIKQLLDELLFDVADAGLTSVQGSNIVVGLEKLYNKVKSMNQTEIASDSVVITSQNPLEPYAAFLNADFINFLKTDVLPHFELPDNTAACVIRAAIKSITIFIATESNYVSLLSVADKETALQYAQAIGGEEFINLYKLSEKFVAENTNMDLAFHIMSKEFFINAYSVVKNSLGAVESAFGFLIENYAALSQSEDFLSDFLYEYIMTIIPETYKTAILSIIESLSQSETPDTSEIISIINNIKTLGAYLIELQPQMEIFGDAAVLCDYLYNKTGLFTTNPSHSRPEKETSLAAISILFRSLDYIDVLGVVIQNLDTLDVLAFLSEMQKRMDQPSDEINEVVIQTAKIVVLSSKILQRGLDKVDEVRLQNFISFLNAATDRITSEKLIDENLYDLDFNEVLQLNSDTAKYPDTLTIEQAKLILTTYMNTFRSICPDDDSGFFEQEYYIPFEVICDNSDLGSFFEGVIVPQNATKEEFLAKINSSLYRAGYKYEDLSETSQLDWKDIPLSAVENFDSSKCGLHEIELICDGYRYVLQYYVFGDESQNDMFVANTNITGGYLFRTASGYELSRPYGKFLNSDEDFSSYFDQANGIDGFLQIYLGDISFYINLSQYTKITVDDNAQPNEETVCFLHYSHSLFGEFVLPVSCILKEVPENPTAVYYGESLNSLVSAARYQITTEFNKYPFESSVIKQNEYPVFVDDYFGSVSYIAVLSYGDLYFEEVVINKNDDIHGLDVTKLGKQTFSIVVNGHTFKYEIEVVDELGGAYPSEIFFLFQDATFVDNYEDEEISIYIKGQELDASEKFMLYTKLGDFEFCENLDELNEYLSQFNAGNAILKKGVNVDATGIFEVELEWNGKIYSDRYKVIAFSDLIVKSIRLDYYNCADYWVSGNPDLTFSVTLGLGEYSMAFTFYGTEEEINNQLALAGHTIRLCCADVQVTQNYAEVKVTCGDFSTTIQLGIIKDSTLLEIESVFIRHVQGTAVFNLYDTNGTEVFGYLLNQNTVKLDNVSEPKIIVEFTNKLDDSFTMDLDGFKRYLSNYNITNVTISKFDLSKAGRYTFSIATPTKEAKFDYLVLSADNVSPKLFSAMPKNGRYTFTVGSDLDEIKVNLSFTITAAGFDASSKFYLACTVEEANALLANLGFTSRVTVVGYDSSTVGDKQVIVSFNDDKDIFIIHVTGKDD